MNKMSTTAICIFIAVSVFSSQAGVKPSALIDLSGWKLQIPGPDEIKVLDGYSSEYFYSASGHSVCFDINASDKGATKKSKYVRSELRHIENWSINESRTMEGEAKVDSLLEPDKVTVAQIHSVKNNGDAAYPLLRLAVNNGDLIAFIKKDDSGDKTESVVLKRKISSEYFSYRIEVNRGILKISVDGDLKLSKDLSFWKYKCYFKVGCYPQAVKGTVKVYYRKLNVYK